MCALVQMQPLSFILTVSTCTLYIHLHVGMQQVSAIMAASTLIETAYIAYYILIHVHVQPFCVGGL